MRYQLQISESKKRDIPAISSSHYLEMKQKYVSVCLGTTFLGWGGVLVTVTWSNCNADADVHTCSIIVSFDLQGLLFVAPVYSCTSSKTNATKTECKSP